MISMIKDVVISIRSVQAFDMEEEDILDFTTDGLYTYDGNVGCLSYMESEVTGMEGTRTSVLVMPDQVVVDRDGMITSRMIFKEGTRSSFLYNTPFGSATLNVNTRRISHQVGEHGGNVEVDYVMDMEHAVVTRNKFQLRVVEQEQMGEQNNG